MLEGKAPSKEMDMHLAMYRARKNARAVIHVHPTYSIAFSTLISRESNDVVPPYTMAFYVRAGRVPMIPYHPSGSHSLHEAVEALAPVHHAILLRQHGLIVAGADMSTAIGVVEEVEQCCQIAVVTALKGAPLTEAQLRAIDAGIGQILGQRQLIEPAVNPLLLAFYGDDFTGSADAMEALTINGVKTALFLGHPTEERLKASRANLQAIGISGTSRTMTPAQMDD